MGYTVIDKIKDLTSQSSQLRRFVNEELPEIRRKYEDKSSSIDKHSDGFCQGDAIQSFCISLSYQSFSGTHGDSSVYSDFRPIDNNLMREYFLKYLNSHTKEIFNEMSEMMMTDAKEMRDMAISEIGEIKRNIEKSFSGD